ncbi:MAG TPA: porin [Usitatibacter sp.]|jgi:predicted porin|nr:porin [Usitatibacter sp.]
MVHRIGAVSALLVAASAAAIAHAEDDAVTLYGRVHLELESVEAHGNGKAEVPRRTRVTDQASLLGVRGTENLGRDLRAFFQLETGFDPQGPGGSFAQRNSAVGLRGSWGSFLVGRWDSPYKSATIAVDQFGDVTIAGIKSANQDRGNFDNRLENVVQYWSPTFAGFTFRGAVTSNEGKTATLDPHVAAGSITWRHGAYYAFYTREEHHDLSASSPRETGDAVGGKMRLGAFEFGGTWQQYRETNVDDRKSYLLFLDYHLGSGKLIYQHQHMKGGGSPTAAEAQCNVDTGAYQYTFSRRTWVRLLYTRIDNNATGDCRFGAGGLGTTGQDSSGWSLGMQHVF